MKMLTINNLYKLLLAVSLIILGAFAMLTFCKHQLNLDSNPRLSLADALYVTDTEVTKIYGPGTRVQQHIIEQLKTQKTMNEITFTQPFVYRMGLDSGDTNEGIILMNFSPAHPQMAKLLSQR